MRAKGFGRRRPASCRDGRDIESDPRRVPSVEIRKCISAREMVMRAREEMNCADCSYSDAIANPQIRADLWCRGRHSPRVGSFTQPEYTCSSFMARVDTQFGAEVMVDPETEFKLHALIVEYAES